AKLAIALTCGVFFIAGCTLFLRDFRVFAIFTMIVFIHVQLNFFLLHKPPPADQFDWDPFLSGIELGSVDIVLSILYALWFAEVSFSRRGARPTLGGPLGPMILLYALHSLLVGFFLAPRFDYAYFEVIVLMKGFLLYLYLVNKTDTFRELRVLVYGLYAGAVAHSLFMIGQFVTRQNYTLKGVYYPVKGLEGFRSGGFFGGNEATSQMLAYTVPLAMGYHFFAAPREHRWLSMLGILTIILGVMTTQYRSAGLSVFIGVVTFMVVAGIRGHLTKQQVLRLAALGSGFVILISPLVMWRFEVGTGTELRGPLMETAEQMIWDNWVNGVGPANYMFRMEEYVPVHLRQTWRYTVHNEYMLQLAERGFFGAGGYYLILLVAAFKFWRASRSLDPWVAMVSIGFFSSIIGSLFHRFTTIYHFPEFWIFSSVVFALATLTDNYVRRQAQTSDVPLNPG
ncbi:MAG: O-antigen ligase family protein, partial [Pseudomonadota bacterium]